LRIIPPLLCEEATRLARPQLGIQSPALEQLVVAALLDDAALVHDDEPVHGRDGGEAMGNRDHGLTFHQIEELLLDGGLHLGIERAGGLIQDQDRRVLQEHARDGDALALTARELSRRAHRRAPIAPAPFMSSSRR